MSTSHPREREDLRLHRSLVLMALVTALLAPVLAFAGSEAEGGGAAFDHEGNDIRYYNHITDFTAATGNTITSFSEAPILAAMVAAGDLPLVEERLPADPYVIVPYQEIGQYGGYAYVGRAGTGYWGDAHLLIGIEPLNRIAGDLSTQSPNVATDYELSSDAKALTVTLREGIKWSTGEPFTTEDIKFWYEDIILNEELTPSPAKFLQPGGELMKMNFLDDYTFQFSFAVPNPGAVEWLPHPNRGVTPINQAKHYFSQFHPNYVGAEKAEALAKEAGFENWVQHFVDKNNSWSELPKFNTERPQLTNYRLAEIGTDLARWERNPYYWKIDVEGNQLPYMDGINVELIQDLQAFAGKIIAGEFTIWTAAEGALPMPSDNLHNFPKQGDHRPIGFLAVPPQPSQFFLQPVWGDQQILATRIFAEDEYKFARHYAYGIVAFKSEHTDDSLDRYISICKGFVSVIADLNTSQVPITAQMVTVWPTDKGHATSLNEKSINGDSDLCEDAVRRIDTTMSKKAIMEAMEFLGEDKLAGEGPYLLAWSPYCADCILYIDLSRVVTIGRAVKHFEGWERQIVRCPRCWENKTKFGAMIVEFLEKHFYNIAPHEVKVSFAAKGFTLELKWPD